MTLSAAAPAPMIVDAPAPASLSRNGLWVLILGAVLISFSGIFVKISELGPTATGFHSCSSPCRSSGYGCGTGGAQDP